MGSYHDLAVDIKPSPIDVGGANNKLGTFYYGQEGIRNDCVSKPRYAWTGRFDFNYEETEEYYRETVWKTAGVSFWIYTDEEIIDNNGTQKYWYRGGSFDLYIRDDYTLKVSIKCGSRNRYVHLTNYPLPKNEWVCIAAIGNVNGKVAVGWKTDDEEHSTSASKNINCTKSHRDCSLDLNTRGLPMYDFVLSPGEKIENLFMYYDVGKWKKKPSGWLETIMREEDIIFRGTKARDHSIRATPYPTIYN